MNIEKLKLALYKKIDINIKSALKKNEECEDFHFLEISSEEKEVLKSCIDINDQLLFGEILFSKIKNLKEKDIQSYYSKVSYFRAA